MPDQPYDPVGAMGGMFAPAYIHGNPESEAAVAKWQADNFALTPDDIEATRGPATTVTNPGVGGLGRGLGTTTTVSGSVDPAALQILAQGGHYTPKAKPIVPATGGGGGVTPPAVSGLLRGGGMGALTNSRDIIAQALINRDMMPDQGMGQRGGYPWGQIGPNVTS